MNTQHRYLRNINHSQLIPCSVRWIPLVLVMEEEKAVEDGKILLIIDAST